ncbi:hypothetical protein GCM10010472_35370 [Pseudonocardia halophobica]|uniref:Integral membrane protein n=1 Tax=Pseudonocardia halophobica TaxID=29401 RepID=A0A9W6NX20_9PSEU|nr:hypothetical protein [Pseudonocardia halophobica]GLL12176.1 hypothetical protein GCM10017577_33170 [Pseudonocardia halophobica]
MLAGEHARPSRPRRQDGRRRSDRVADLVAWLVSATVLVLLGASVLVGLEVHGDLTDRAAVEARDRTPITAVLTEDVPVLPEGRNRVPADVRWTDRTGVEHVGRTEVAGPRRAGDPVDAWVTADGRLVRAPLTGTEIVFVTVASAGAVLVIGGFVVAALAHLAAGGVARLRAAEWEREWDEVEPRWRDGR